MTSATSKKSYIENEEVIQEDVQEYEQSSAVVNANRSPDADPHAWTQPNPIQYPKLREMNQSPTRFEVVEEIKTTVHDCDAADGEP